MQCDVSTTSARISFPSHIYGSKVGISACLFFFFFVMFFLG